MSRGYLERDVVNNDLVRKNPRCLKAVREVMKGNYGATDDLQQTPRKMFETQAIVVYGGKTTFCYLPEKDLWYQLQDSHSEHRCYHVTSFRGNLYVFPTRPKPGISFLSSHEWTSHIEPGTCHNAERYDPLLNTWVSLAQEKNRNRVYRSAVVVIGNAIYSIEHSLYRDRAQKYCPYREDNLMKRYDDISDSWLLVPVLSPLDNFAKEEACVVTMDNYLYVIGNDSARRFDTADGMKCERIARTRQPRYNACGVAARGKIFIAGGEIDTEVLEIESYDLESDSKWWKRTKIPPAQRHRDWKACTQAVHPGVLKHPITRKIGDDD
ncbi:hypothetical protein ACROYT_G024458 [Oculina patagonica]